MKQIQLIGISQEEHNKLIFDHIDKKIDELKKNYKPREPEIYLTRAEVCKILHINMSTLYVWRDKKILIPLSIGNRVLYKRSDLESKLTELK